MKPAADSAWQLVLGAAIWGLWFVVVYGAQGATCAALPPDPVRGAATALNVGLLLLSLATTALLLGLAWRCYRASRRPGAVPARRFIASAGTALHTVAAVSTVVVALPLLLLPPCL